jgi:parallel beta-helix repeat protein
MFKKIKKRRFVIVLVFLGLFSAFSALAISFTNDVKLDLTGLTSEVYVNGDPTGSQCSSLSVSGANLTVIGIPSGNPFTLENVSDVVLLRLTPSGATGSFSLTSANVSGGYIIQWNTTSSVLINYIVKVPLANTNYEVKVNNVSITGSPFNSGALAQLSFGYTGAGTFTISAAAAAMDISTCQTLNTAGQTYRLINNITVSGYCFFIGANNITLDLNGYTITGNGSTGSGVIRDAVIRNNITVKNGTVSGFQNGVIFNGIQGGLIENITATNNTNFGIYLSVSSANITVRNNTVSNNMNGIQIFGGANNNTIENNIATNNSVDGIHLEGAGANNILSGNQSNFNGRGFWIFNSSGNTFANNTANNNTPNSGFEFSSSSNNTVTGNTANNNSGAGFSLTNSNSNNLANNIANNNNYGIRVTSGTANSLSGGNFCDNFSADVSCLVNQVFSNDNYCDNGAVCGGVCVSCSTGCQTHEIWGWAYSENISWISFSCQNTMAIGTGVNYGVDIDEANSRLSGYAWSDYIGWISFNNTDLVGCPSGTCQASINMSTGGLTGWARALSPVGKPLSETGGWDGWIKLSGSNYGVTLNSTPDPSEFQNWAWGGDPNNDNNEAVIGFISFNGDNVVGGADYAVYTGLSVNNAPTAAISCNPASCTIYHTEVLILNNDSSDPDGTAPLGNITQSQWETSKPPAGYIVRQICSIVPILCNLTPQNYVGVGLAGIGSYIARLTVTDAGGLFSTATKNFSILRDASAGFMCSLGEFGPWENCDSMAIVPLDGQIVWFFDDSSLAEYSQASQGAFITSRRWSKNGVDFSVLNNQKTSIAASLPSMNIILTVTDNAGRSASITHTIGVGTLPLPTWNEIAPF